MTIARLALAALALGALPGAAIAKTAKPSKPAPAAVAATPAPVDPERLAVAQRIVAIIVPPEGRAATFANAARQVYAQYHVTPRFPAGVDDAGLKKLLDDFNAALPGKLAPVLAKHTPLITEALARAYAREFTVEELQAIEGFAQTPAGRHFAQRYNAILQDSEVTGADKAYLGELVGQAQAATKTLNAQVDAYLAAHPDLAAKVKAATPAKP